MRLNQLSKESVDVDLLVHVVDASNVQFSPTWKRR